MEEREREERKLLQGAKEEVEKNYEKGCAYRKRRMNYDAWRIGHVLGGKR